MSTTPRTDAASNGYYTDIKNVARQLETELSVMKSEFGKMVLSAAVMADRNVELRRRAEIAEASAKLWEADALRYANNTEFWQVRAEKAEAALQKILNVMREDSNGKDPMDAVEDIIIATKEASK